MQTHFFLTTVGYPLLKSGWRSCFRTHKKRQRSKLLAEVSTSSGEDFIENMEETSPSTGDLISEPSISEERLWKAAIKVKMYWVAIIPVLVKIDFDLWKGSTEFR